MDEIKKELEEQELEQVSGGTGEGSGYNYVSLYFLGSELILYAGYNVSAVHVYQNDSQIYYTYKMTPGQKESLYFSDAAPRQFKVTGCYTNTQETFEYTFNLS